jgi:hypothetical protein
MFLFTSISFLTNFVYIVFSSEILDVIVLVYLIKIYLSLVKTFKLVKLFKFETILLHLDIFSNLTSYIVEADKC